MKRPKRAHAQSAARPTKANLPRIKFTSHRGNVAHSSLDSPIGPIDPELVSDDSCEALWLAVIEQAFLDAKWNSPAPPNSAPGPRGGVGRWRRRQEERKAAMRFLQGNFSTFITICLAAKVDADWIKRKANELFCDDALWKELKSEMK